MTEKENSVGFYVTHPAVNGGVELHIDTAVGIKELNLGDLQQLSEIDDELKDLWLENLPEEVTINALTIAMSLRASCAILPRKSLFLCRSPSCAKTRTATTSPSAGLRPLARSQTQTLSC